MYNSFCLALEFFVNDSKFGLWECNQFDRASSNIEYQCSVAYSSPTIRTAVRRLLKSKKLRQYRGGTSHASRDTLRNSLCRLFRVWTVKFSRQEWRRRCRWLLSTLTDHINLQIKRRSPAKYRIYDHRLLWQQRIGESIEWVSYSYIPFRNLSFSINPKILYYADLGRLRNKQC